MTDRRLIESAFPLKQTSLDSVHEKNVRHGHISTLHIWPARRPLAACRAALLATLLPNPETPAERQALCELIGGTVRQVVKQGKDGGDSVVEETVGGILHWKREQENAAVLEDLRRRIRAAFNGEAPKVLDPFAGGGAIPLEAMRLGCEVTAADINPVAWFILKCTLEYPQKLAGQTRPLPDFILNDREFMTSFFKAQSLGKKELERALEDLGHRQSQQTLAYSDLGKATLEADLAWHVRAWGQWVLNQARRELGQFYPTYADFEALKPGHVYYEKRPMQCAPLTEDGLPDLAALNAEFAPTYLEDERNPRWVAKPTVAYLWARTVTCKNSACRATVPLLKTRWLAKKDHKRVLLTMEPDADRKAVIFGIDRHVPAGGKTPAQRKEHDQTIGAGTMSRSGAKCPCCGTLITMEDIRFEGRGGRLGAVMTAVVVDGQKGKEYRLPTPHEIAMAEAAGAEVERVFKDVPFGFPEEPTPKGGNGAARAFSVDGYGFDQWKKLFTPRQLVALGTLIKITQGTADKNYNEVWKEAINAYLAIAIDRLISFTCTNIRWKLDAEAVVDAFARFALPIMWDFAEPIVINNYAGSYLLCYERISLALQNLIFSSRKNNINVENISVIKLDNQQKFDAIITDPPYYDAIPYSDLMDFFYVWLRRTLYGLSPEIDQAFSEPLAPKWNHETNDGELIDDASRFNGDKAASKQNYEDGMARAFQACHAALKPNGRFVVVFAHKQPDAWETLASAMVKAGFAVTASWPIQTEMANRTRAMASAALASSIWMVCKKRPASARPGWESPVLVEMRDHITQQLRDFWDAGIRGPDFVWAATGPALQAFSQYPVVKKEGGGLMSIGDFLIHVRRFVVDFVVGRVLSRDNADGASATAESLDALTAYYLLHRHDFGFEPAPIGQVILYGQSCGLSDRDLTQTWDLLASPKTAAAEASDDEDATEEDADTAQPGGATVKLKAWNQRKEKNLGYEAPGGRSIPLIDRIHRLMQLWKAGNSAHVDEYLDANGLRQQELFKRVLQALIELAPAGSEERAVLENLSNHIGVKIARPESKDFPLNFEESPR